MERKIVLEVERQIGGTKVTLRKHEIEGEEIAKTIKMLNAELDKVGNIPQISNSASISPEINLPLGLTPTPQLNFSVQSMPNLDNPPHTYSPAASIVEILDPQKSTWAREAKTVKEMQQRLLDLGVHGVSNIQNFDWVVRSMLKAGKVKREKIDGVYKYYITQRGV